MTTIRTAVALGALLFAFASAPVLAAPPQVPLSIVYQGVLLDNAGEPRTGNVDLKVRIFDATSGGTLLYVQSYTAVNLDGGTFSIALGPTGAASDGAATPLTTSLADVFAGDLAATAPERWLELQVGTSSALARTRLQSAAFALRAGSAESADFALEAETAANATGVGGLPSEVVNQIWENSNLDGAGPNNSDPIEGLLDSDGNGVANFLDPDNDGDGVHDSTEIAQGADPNLPTPRASAVQPARGIRVLPTAVTVVGGGFQPGLSADLGGLALSPQSVTPTSFLAEIPPAPAGSRTLALANPNGETGSLAAAFVHADTLTGGGSVDVLGAQQVLLSSGGGYRVSTDSDLHTDASFTVVPNVVGATRLGWDGSGRVNALYCRGLSACLVEFRTDSDGDFDLGDETPVAIESGQIIGWMAPSLVFDPSGRPAGGYLRNVSGNQVPVVLHDRDGDGLFTGPNEKVALPGFPGSGIMRTAAAVDPLGRVAFVHQGVAGASTVVTAYDRSGEGAFDASEISSYTYTTQPTCLGATFDPSGRLAVVVGANGAPLTVGRDLDGDGDWAEAGETTILGSSPDCAIASGPGVPLVVTRLHESGDLEVRRDLNDDGDFGDAEESRVLITDNPATAHSVQVGATGITFVGTASELAVTPP